VADVVEVLDQLAWQAPVVIGHSWGGHLLLHLLAGIAVFAVLAKLTSNDMAALIGALLFALHPIQVETVGLVMGLDGTGGDSPPSMWRRMMVDDMRHRGVKNFWLYLIGPGTLSWSALYLAGAYPALALVPIVPFFPHGLRDRGLLVEPAPEAHDTLTQFERWWRFPVEGVLLLFGLVNAGVPFHGLEPGVWAIPIGALARPIGIVAAAGMAILAGLHLPRHVGWRELIVVGATASIGLVFALLFATAVMPLGPVLLEMKMGALVTIAGAGLAFLTARVLHVGRFGP